MPDATLAARQHDLPPRRAPRDGSTRGGSARGGSRRGGTRLVPLLALLALGAALSSLVPRPAAAQQRDTTRTPARDTTRAGPPRTPADTAAARDTVRDTTRARSRPRARRAPTATAAPDSVVRPPISPRRAFLYSLVVPGQGQTALHRPRAAALFATIELGSIWMLAKSKNDLRIARARPDSVSTISVDSVSGETTVTRTPDRLAARERARRLHVEDWIATLIFNHLFAGADAFVAAQLWDLPTEVSFQPMPRGAALTVSVPW